MKQLAYRLQQLRRAHRLSQEDLAAQLHVSRQAISKWERGEALPDTENLILLARLYHTSLDALVGNSPASTADTELPTVASQDAAADTTAPQRASCKQRLPYALLHALPYPIVVTALFLLLGFLADAWAVAWILFVTIPVYYSLIECIQRRCFSPFAYPVFITCLFLFFGMQLGVWHPMWLIYLTIPIYYSIAEAIDRAIHPRTGEEAEGAEDEEDEEPTVDEE